VSVNPESQVRNEMDQRLASRQEYTDSSDAALQTVYEEAWEVRRSATEVVVTVTEEMVARAVRAQFPDADQIVLYEDHSHDAAHAHVLHVVDADGHVLIAGTGEEWHDADWSSDIDELVWDLYHLDRSGFLHEGDQRLRRITVG
jgi:hypothetical protein